MFSVKKILLISFILVLIVAIPITIYLISIQQKAKTSSSPASTLSFSPVNQTGNVGQDLTFDLNINPGSNTVSLIKVSVSYDPTKLSATDGAFIPNNSAFPSIVSGPTYAPGKVSLSLSIGANAPPITKQTKIGTITFKTLAPTDTTSTQLTFANDTQVLSTGASDQFSQNVLSSTVPADITISSSQGIATPTPTLAQAPVETTTPTIALTPTPIATEPSTITPTQTPATTIVPTPTISIAPTITQTPINNSTTSASGPICISFTADRDLHGTVPFNVNFTLVATDAAAVTTKATFNFGDGQVKDLTAIDGISGHGANALQSHVYNSAGTFIASGSITDADGNVSSTDNCQLTVVVSGPNGTPQPSPLPPTGPSNIVYFGTIGIVLAILGAVLLMAL